MRSYHISIIFAASIALGLWIIGMLIDQHSYEVTVAPQEGTWRTDTKFLHGVEIKFDESGFVLARCMP